MSRPVQHRDRATCYRCFRSIPIKKSYDGHGGSGCCGLGTREHYFYHKDNSGEYCKGSDMVVRPVPEGNAAPSDLTFPAEGETLAEKTWRLIVDEAQRTQKNFTLRHDPQLAQTARMFIQAAIDASTPASRTGEVET